MERKVKLIGCLTLFLVAGGTGWGNAENKFDRPVNRFGLISGGLAINPSSKGPTSIPSIGLELFAYERIGRSGWAFRLSPLNIYLWDGVVEKGPVSRTIVSGGNTTTFSVSGDRNAGAANYIPFWVKHYFKGGENFSWPYAGIGFGIHSFAQDSFFIEDDEANSGLTLGGVFGFDFGRSLLIRFVLVEAPLPVIPN